MTTAQLGDTALAPTLNGLDVDALRSKIEGVRADARLGASHWSVRSRWVGGTRSDHEILGATIGGALVARDFTVRVDEPTELGGTNRYANPQEYLLSALNACMMVGYSAIAALLGIRLTRLEIDIEGDIDLRGFLGIDPKVPAGYPSLCQTVRIAGDASPERMRELHAMVQATSPNYFNITRAVPVVSNLLVG